MGFCASIVGALLVTGISFVWKNVFILFILCGCVVGFAVRLSGQRHDNKLAIIGGLFTALSCVLALFLICFFNDGSFIGTITDGAWISMVIAIIIGAVQAKNNEFIDNP